MKKTYIALETVERVCQNFTYILMVNIIIFESFKICVLCISRQAEAALMKPIELAESKVVKIDASKVLIRNRVFSIIEILFTVYLTGSFDGIGLWLLCGLSNLS